MQSECISRAMVFQKFPDTAPLPLSLSLSLSLLLSLRIDVPSPPAAATKATPLSRSCGWDSRAFSAHEGRNPSNIRAAGFPGWSGQIAETITGSFRIPDVAGLSDVLGRSRERLNSSSSVNPVKSEGIRKSCAILYAAKFIASLGSRDRDFVAGSLLDYRSANNRSRGYRNKKRRIRIACPRYERYLCT